MIQAIESMIAEQNFDAAISFIMDSLEKNPNEQFNLIYLIEMAQMPYFTHKKPAQWLLEQIEKIEDGNKVNDEEVAWELTMAKIELRNAFDGSSQVELCYLWEFVRRFPKYEKGVIYYVEKCAEYQFFTDLWFDDRFILEHYEKASTRALLYVLLSLAAYHVDIRWNTEKRWEKVAKYLDKAYAQDAKITKDLILQKDNPADGRSYDWGIYHESVLEWIDEKENKNNNA